MTTWTRFMDMHSGGGTKVYVMPDGSTDEGGNWRMPDGGQGKEFIYIEADEQEARVIFYNRFGHNPERVTCTCCGEDYSIGEHPSLEVATGYDRGCRYDEKTRTYVDEPMRKNERFYRAYVPLSDYVARPNVLVITASEITADERKGDVPVQGYVWA